MGKGFRLSIYNLTNQDVKVDVTSKDSVSEVNNTEGLLTQYSANKSAYVEYSAWRSKGHFSLEIDVGAYKKLKARFREFDCIEKDSTFRSGGYALTVDPSVEPANADQYYTNIYVHPDSMKLDTSWMKDFFSKNSNCEDTPICDFALLGSHDSGTYKYDKKLEHYVSVQSRNIEKQLKAGVNFLDIRLGWRKYEENGKDKYKLQIYHGEYDCLVDFHTVYSAVEKFVSNTSNFVIMSIKSEVYDDQWIWNKFKAEYLNGVGKSNWYTGDQIPKYKDVKGKIVLLNRINRIKNSQGFQLNFKDNTKKQAEKNDHYTVQDYYKVDHISFNSAPAIKYDIVKNYQDDIYGRKGRGKYNFCFLSASISGYKLGATPARFAEYVNSSVLSNLRHLNEYWNGINIMDFAGKDKPYTSTQTDHITQQLFHISIANTILGMKNP